MCHLLDVCKGALAVILFGRTPQSVDGATISRLSTDSAVVRLRLVADDLTGTIRDISNAFASRVRETMASALYCVAL